MEEFQKFFRKLFGNKLAFVGMLLLISLAVMAIFAPILAPMHYDDQDLFRAREGPSKEHIFGTDEFGRDIFSRIIYGSRIALLAGLISVSVAALIGGSIGMLAGYFGGRVDQVLSRVVDIFLAFPYILLALAIVTILGRGMAQTLLAIGLANAPRFARIVRGFVIDIKTGQFVEAAQALGASHFRIILRHVLPNCLPGIIIFSTLTMGMAIISESTLSFLGLGVQPPLPSWGNMLDAGRRYMRLAPHLSIFPGLAITLTVMAFNFLGDSLRDLLDPRMRQ